MSSLSIACPGCQRQLVFPDHSVVGKTARCPECGQRFPIEVPAEAGLPTIEVSESPVVVRSRGRKSAGSRSSRRPARSRPAWMPLAITAGLGVVAVVLLFAFGVGGDGDPGGSVGQDQAAGVDEDQGPGDGAEPAVALPPAVQSTGTIRVETTPAGAMVLIDDQRVHNAEGKPQLSPCVVTASKGAHAVTIVREGFQDQTRQVTVSAKEVDLVFQAAREGASALLATRWFSDARVGEPVPIAAANAAGRPRDPWLSSDGLSLWFVADGTGGRGVYFATRPSSFDEFNHPQFVPITRGRDRRASPSVTTRGLLVYAVPEKAAIWGAVRGGPLQPFDDKQPLASSSKTSPRWTASQVLGGGLHLFFVESVGDVAKSFHASRIKTDVAFGPAEAFELPGIRPCLSGDGLRQYVFDGKTLVRWRRSSLRGRFARDETVAELELPDYVDDPLARQFAVSDDERWLVYSGGPSATAPMMMVRLHQRPNRGTLVVGTPAKPRPVVAKVDPKMSGKDREKKSAVKLMVGPKALAKAVKESPSKPAKSVKITELPLSTYMASWQKLLATRDYTAARSHLAAARRNPVLSDVDGLLEWDAQELASIETFWKEARRVVSEMKPDDPVRIGSVKLKFVKFENDNLVCRGQAKRVERPLVKMAASDLVGLVESTLPAGDTAAQLRLGVFLYHDLQGRGSSAARRLQRAGPAGAEFLDRRGLRVMAEARAEIARNRPERALPLLARIEKTYSKTSAAKQVAGAWAELYSLAKWTRLGSRKWEVDGVAWRAAPGRSAGSLVVSPREMPGFDLSLEWKTEGETGQGGVFFRYAGTGNPTTGALKLQLSSDAGVAADQFSTGALFGVTAPTDNMAKPNGQWNTLKLRVDGDAVRVEINGRRVLMTTVADPDRPSVGHVALDGITGGITYRKVLLVPLAGR